MTRTSKPSEQAIEVARVYASALLELARSKGTEDALLEELQVLAQLLADQPALETLLDSPRVDAEERGALIDRIFLGRLDELLVDTLQVMNRKGRSGLGRALAEAYRQEYGQLKGLVEATARTAVPLGRELKDRLRRVVSGITGKTVLLEERVDESLIGGMVLHVGDAKMDTSVAKELRAMRRRLADRASDEARSATIWQTSRD